ncbi:hypothetical protein SARC_03348 [Sphaeroforma arctica JP610]|uniref:NADH dehydrogenase [ubiquinone] iron-sulfur protein 4, mitochondrial n=1 Tax=Sphaeroforma arctica JP610 TaxID=667725 RepID=A0A0L0G5W7_9EUKA|nr:hypothetical protein SARC_03348 [Sphaeroforma arctica JP610]KNC84420.1 hypothetical protein SARC_03348 [Sphaeroforma arctica JP610]|eukprot:XP_014158322.1 hypothetical protein SARC_03348 [Sphaeroforma arctica JP610]
MGEPNHGMGFQVQSLVHVMVRHADPLSNLEMDFPTKEDAIAFADKMGWTPEVTEPNIKTFKKKSYSANFAWDKRTRVATK